MKRFVFVLACLFAVSLNAFAENDNYVIDDNAIEQVFAEAAEVSVADAGVFSLAPMPTTENGMAMPTLTNASVNPWAAFALCWIVGGFGIHRHYMGTSKAMWALYTFTCGGIFGIVTMVDWVVLLIGAAQDNIRPYCNNDSFFMWL